MRRFWLFWAKFIRPRRALRSNGIVWNRSGSNPRSRRSAHRRGRGYKSLAPLGRVTAPGLRTQKCEIKNKKPTGSDSPAMPALLHQLRRGRAKMIRFDSLGENFRALCSVRQRSCAQRHRRPASNTVVTASNLNRFESLPAKSRCRPRAVRGGGGLNLWAAWGPLPHGASRTDFFWSARGLNYFSEIKEIKRPSANCLRASRVFSRRWIRCSGLSPGQIGAWSSIYFPRTLRWGAVKSLGSSGGDRMAPLHGFPRNSENFFCLATAGAEQAAKTSRNSGWGGSGADVTRK